jgi:hypothetical protein
LLRLHCLHAVALFTVHYVVNQAKVVNMARARARARARANSGRAARGGWRRPEAAGGGQRRPEAAGGGQGGDHSQLGADYSQLGADYSQLGADALPTPLTSYSFTPATHNYVVTSHSLPCHGRVRYFE